MNRFRSWLTMGMICAGWFLAAPLQAMTVAQLEFTRGAVNYEGEHHTIMDRLFGQDGTLKMGRYQAIGAIMPVIGEAGETFSLFTAGFRGEAAPSVEISGSSMKADLSSLFFGVGRGDEYRMLNIGGLATGLVNPDSKEFSLSWDRVFDGGTYEGRASFFLSGIAKVDALPTPIPAGLVLYATGLFSLGSWAWRCHRAGIPVAV